MEPIKLKTADVFVGAHRAPTKLPTGPDIRFWNRTIWLGGSVTTKDELDELVSMILALKEMLPSSNEAAR